MNTYRSPKTEIRKSLIDGKGLFAKEDIQKGEIVAIKGGHIISLHDFQTLDARVKEFCLQIEEDFFIGPLVVEEIASNAVFVNHSCHPNLVLKGQILCVAMRDISAGQEITNDYSTTYTHPEAFEDMQCNCKTPFCRGKITGNDWQLKELQDRYGDNFSQYILEKIKMSRNGSK